MFYAFSCWYLFRNVFDQWTDATDWLWKHLVSVCMETSTAQAFLAVPNTAHTHTQGAVTQNELPGLFWCLRLLDFTAHTEHLSLLRSREDSLIPSQLCVLPGVMKSLFPLRGNEIAQSFLLTGIFPFPNKVSRGLRANLLQVILICTFHY